jgi:L-serine dehydratase
MSFLFESFSGWKKYCEEHSLSLVDVVLEYEVTQKGATSEQVRQGLQKAYQVMKDAVKTG